MEPQEKVNLTNYSCRYIKGIGPKNAEKLEKIGISSVQDVLFHLPFRYEDRTKITPIQQIIPGKQSVVFATVCSTEVVRRGRPQLCCHVRDDSGSMVMRLIHFSAAQKQNLCEGARLLIVGEARLSRLGLEMIHPEYQFVSPEQSMPLAKTLTPVYPTTDGVSQRLWMKLSEHALSLLNQENDLKELLPEAILKQHKLSSLKEALNYIHRPSSKEDIAALTSGKHPMQQRLILEELLAHRLALTKLRHQEKSHAAIALPLSADKKKRFISALDFSLTAAQHRVLNEIENDLNQSSPMMRLVQGDVGSGKTIVAAISMLHVVDAGKQAVFMAPTELLAQQHYKNICDWFEPLGFNVVMLKGSLTAKNKRQSLEGIASGQAQVIVGTHALFQADVNFKSLALVVVDEQHRFGVGQRLSLQQKGEGDDYHPHQLIMTATPIPRTLAMNFYADLDSSSIDELPPGRTPVQTVVMSNEKRAQIVEKIKDVSTQGQQVYWVCPLIEESEILQFQAAETSYEMLKQQLPNLKVGLVHGRLKAKEKDKVMEQFKAGEINLLVATTVIEVGVDVPTASLMVIENSERMGLSQLHQLRGRVGRGALKSYCILLYQPPVKGFAKERLAIMRETNDGFKIAEKDLEIRGPGEVLGTRQTGAVLMKIANVVRDQKMLPKVQGLADQLWQRSPLCCDQLIVRWLGDKERFAKV
jgi:ATP-dependent DNA helicase RecG